MATKFIKALRRTFSETYSEPEVHFHQGTSDDFPEVCHDGRCDRPQLRA